MIHVGTASGEGGPFLLADARAVRVWHWGASNDYEDLCKALDAGGPTRGLPWLLGTHDATAVSLTIWRNARMSAESSCASGPLHTPANHSYPWSSQYPPLRSGR
jgi:hypothetical protein